MGILAMEESAAGRTKDVRVWLGTLSSVEDATPAYDAALRDIHGLRAILNFPSLVDAVPASGRKRGRDTEVANFVANEEDKQHAPCLGGRRGRVPEQRDLMEHSLE